MYTLSHLLFLLLFSALHLRITLYSTNKATNERIMSSVEFQLFCKKNRIDNEIQVIVGLKIKEDVQRKQEQIGKNVAAGRKQERLSSSKNHKGTIEGFLLAPCVYVYKLTFFHVVILKKH